MGMPVVEPVPPLTWSDQIRNYTRYDQVSRDVMGMCNRALIELTRDKKYCPDDAATSTVNVQGSLSNVQVQASDQGDCDSCSPILRPFFFDFVSGDAGQTKCLNFFVGHMLNECGAT